MRRVLIILLISFVLGTLIAKFSPAWQGGYLAAGEQRLIDAQAEPVELTLSDRKSERTYFPLKEEHVAALQNDSRITGSPGLVLTESEGPTLVARDVQWSETRNKKTVKYTAPGLVASMKARVTAEPKADEKSGTVAWTSPTLANYQQDAKAVIRRGSAKVGDDGTILLRRYLLFPTAAARDAALFKASIGAGAPISMALLGALLWIFGFPRKDAPPVQPEGLPATFGRKYKGVRFLFGLIACLTAIVIGLTFGVVTLLQADHIDIEGDIAMGVGITAFGILYMIIVGYFCLRALREVTLTSDGVEVRAGAGNKLRFQANWGDVRGVEHTVRHHKGKAYEQLLITNNAGRTVKIGKDHVQDFDILREAAAHLHRQSRRPAQASAGGIEHGNG